MNHQETIVATLRRLRRRILLNRLTRDLIVGSGLILLAWIVLQVFGGSPAFRGAVVGILTAALGVRLAWGFIRRESLGRTAGLADTRGDLKDEMKTAYSFIREERSSPWVKLQVSRAVDRSHQLDPKAIAPISVPGKLLLADGLLLVVGILLWATPGLLREPTPDYADMSEVEKQVRKVGELLQSSEIAGETEEEPPVEAVEKLDDTIRRLERGELSLEEGLQEIQETENLLTEAGLDMASMKEDLEDIAGSLEGQGPLDEIAEALKQQNLQEAAELLRALAEKALNGESLEGLEELAEQLDDAETRSAQLEDWIEALKKAAEALESGDLNAAEQLMGDAAEQLESIDAQMKLKSQMNQAGMELEQLRNALAQDARFQKVSSQEDMAQAGVQALDPLDEEAQALADALASLNLPESEDPMGGNPDGIPMGPVVENVAAEVETIPLDVQLEREMLEATEEPEETVPEEITQKASREAESELDYDSVRSRSDYVESDVMSAERIPWPYREIVKRYFQTLQRKTEQ